jgi:hypothetical protein
MGSHPFSRKSASQVSQANRRRSTRVDFSTPVIISGRDATGQAFREETATTTVNLHGAGLCLEHRILIGMQVTIENPQNGLKEKAVCVRRDEPSQEGSPQFVALQLVRPANIWGMENPPADWAQVAAEEGASASLGVAKRERDRRDLSPSQTQLEQRSAEIVESILRVVRQQVEAITQAALGDMEKRLNDMETAAASRLGVRVEESLAQTATLLESMKKDCAEQMSSCSTKLVAASEQDLRSVFSEMLAPLVGVSAPITPVNRVETFLKK